MAVVANKFLFQSTRLWNLDIENPATSFAREMMMPGQIPIVTSRPGRNLHLFEITVLDQNFEISIDRTQRKTG